MFSHVRYKLQVLPGDYMVSASAYTDHTDDIIGPFKSPSVLVISMFGPQLFLDPNFIYLCTLGEFVVIHFLSCRHLAPPELPAPAFSILTADRL